MVMVMLLRVVLLLIMFLLLTILPDTAAHLHLLKPDNTDFLHLYQNIGPPSA